MEELIERTLEMQLSIGDKYNCKSQCAHELSDEVLERIKSNDPKLTSLKLGAFNNTHHALPQKLLSLLHNKDLCDEAGILIGSNTHLNELYINIHMRSDDDDENYDYDDLAENYDEFLRGVANNRSLTVLDLGYCPAKSNAIHILAPLIEKGTPKSISIQNCTGDHIKLLASLFRTNNEQRGTLKNISLDGTRGGNAISDYYTLDLIRTLSRYHSLESLILNWTIINAETSRALSNMLRDDSCTLKKLTLEENEFDDESLSVLAEGLLENSSLEELNLLGSEHVSAEGWVNFFRILRPAKLGALHTLCLERNHITDEAVVEMTHVFANNNTLKRLNLSLNNSITTAGWQTLASIFLNPNSAIDTMLTKGNPSFDDGAAIAWVNALSQSKNTKLNELLLSPRGITSRGWLALENLVCNKMSIDSMYGSNHTFKFYFEDTTIEQSTVVSAMRSYQDFQLSCLVAECSSRIMVRRLVRSQEKDEKDDKLRDFMKEVIERLSTGRITGHKMALHKIIQFYFKSGEANMKDIWDMEFNVMVHAIARIGCFAKDNFSAIATQDGISTSVHTLLYQIMRSVPSLVDVSSSNRKNRKVGSK